MPSDPTHPNTLPNLLRELRDETTTLLGQEVALAKAELKESAADFAKHATHIAIGGFVAYAGAIVLLIGLGLLGSWLLERAGWQRDIALWVSISVVGLVVVIIGTSMLSRARRALSSDEIAPKLTIETLREDKDWARNKLQPSS